jgi:hypothetical protein
VILFSLAYLRTLLCSLSLRSAVNGFEEVVGLAACKSIVVILGLPESSEVRVSCAPRFGEKTNGLILYSIISKQMKL